MAFKDTINIYAATGMAPAIAKNDTLVLIRRDGTDTTRRSQDTAFTTQQTLTMTHKVVGKRTLHTMTLSVRPDYGADAEVRYGQPVLARLTLDGPSIVDPQILAAFELAGRGLFSAANSLATDDNPTPFVPEAISQEEISNSVTQLTGMFFSRFVLGES